MFDAPALTRVPAFGRVYDSKFPIVLLDESSQMVEPLSLLPMKFGCRHLLGACHATAP